MTWPNFLGKMSSFGCHKHGWKCPEVSFKTLASATTNIAGEGSTFGFGRSISKFDDTVDECGIMGEHRITDFSVIV